MTKVRPNRQAADTPEFVSIADAPPKLVRAGKRHGPGLIILGMDI
jgi:surfeit locus 1 family protein